MSFIYLFIGLVVGYYIGKQSAEKENPAVRLNEIANQRKTEAKNKIMELFASHPEIKNDDVEKLLGVSDATATNYLQELENAGRVVQNGEGRSASYVEKNG